MRAITITRHGGPDVLEVRESADPTPKAGEIRVRVKAAGLNFAEIMARMGMYPGAPKPPSVVGYEVSGVVDALGEGVTTFKEGARVIALTRFGGHADVVCVPIAQAREMPAAMSYEEGAALPVNYLTAYHMIFRVACVRPREHVLIHMAAGGVGLAVLQICKTLDGVVTFGTTSASKHDAARDNGCTHPIDYRKVDYAAEIRRLTGGRGVDVVLDPLGGKDWKKGYDLLRPAGRMVAFGFANMASGERRNYLNIARQFFSIPRFSPMGLMEQNRSVAGVNMGNLWGELDLLGEELEALLVMYQEGKIKPRVGATFPYAQAADAHRFITGRQNVGKVVLVP